MSLRIDKDDLTNMKTISFAHWIVTVLVMFLFPIHEACRAMAIGEVLPLGDSITDGFATTGGYRARLNLLLNNNGDVFKFIGSATNNSTAALTAAGQEHHEGHTGYRIDQIDGNLTGLVSSAPVPDNSNGGHWLDGGHGTGRAAIFPDLILLHIGTNDASQGRTAAQMQALLQSLLAKIKTNRPNAQVIVASLIPRTDDSNLEAIQMSYNSGIPATVAAQGANFHFLDMHAVLNSGDLADGQHPNQGGFDKMANAWATALHAVAAVEPLELAAAVSRRAHGAAGNFDINLPLTGEPGVECRTAANGGGYMLLLTFTNNVVGGNAAVTSGNGSVSGSPVLADNTMKVNLTEVTNAQQVTLAVSGVMDAYSHVLATRSVKMNVLLADTTGNKVVNSSDVSQTKIQSGGNVGAENFREDVTCDGSINSSDVSTVKSQSGQAIP